MPNVLGGTLESCSCSPMTGYFRDGLCRTDETDQGSHTICAVMTAEFLEYSKVQGNDLSTPRPEYDFPGLKSGDKWCLCASRWMQAYNAGSAPDVCLEATHVRCLDYVELEMLMKHRTSVS